MLSRRSFLQTAGVAGAALLAAPLLEACSRGQQQLLFQNWTDYIDPSILVTFQQQEGITASYQTYVSNDELQRRLVSATAGRRRGRTGVTFDLMVPSENFVRRFHELGLLEPVNAGTLSNIGNLDPAFRTQGFDPGNTYTIPWATGTTGIGYDRTVVKEPPDWTVFGDDRYKGRMTVLDEERDAFGAALLSLGLDPNTTSQQEIDAARDQLLKWKGVIKGFDSDYQSALADGTIVLAHAYSGDVLQAKATNPDLEFVLPKQGGLRWVDSLAVPVDASHLDSARTFMNFYLQPEISAANANAIRYDTANKAAVPLLDPDVRNDPVIFPPPDVLARLSFTADLGPDIEALYAKAWAQVLSG